MPGEIVWRAAPLGQRSKPKDYEREIIYVYAERMIRALALVLSSRKKEAALKFIADLFPPRFRLGDLFPEMISDEDDSERQAIDPSLQHHAARTERMMAQILGYAADQRHLVYDEEFREYYLLLDWCECLGAIVVESDTELHDRWMAVCTTGKCPELEKLLGGVSTVEAQVADNVQRQEVTVMAVKQKERQAQRVERVANDSSILKRIAVFMQAQGCLHKKMLVSALVGPNAPFMHLMGVKDTLDAFAKQGVITKIGDGAGATIELTDLGKTRSGIMRSIDWLNHLMIIMHYLGWTTYDRVVTLDEVEAVIGATHPSIADFPYGDLGHAVSFLNGCAGPDQQTQPLISVDGEAWQIKPEHIIPPNVRNSRHDRALIVRPSLQVSAAEAVVTVVQEKPIAVVMNSPVVIEEKEVIVAETKLVPVEVPQAQTQDPILEFKVNPLLHSATVSAIQDIRMAVQRGLVSDRVFTGTEFGRVFEELGITAPAVLRWRMLNQTAVLVCHGSGFQWDLNALKSYFLHGASHQKKAVQKVPVPVPLPPTREPERAKRVETSDPEEATVIAVDAADPVPSDVLEPVDNGENFAEEPAEEVVVIPDPKPAPAPTSSDPVAMIDMLGMAQQIKRRFVNLRVRVEDLEQQNEELQRQNQELDDQVATLTEERDRLVAENKKLQEVFQELATAAL